MILKLQVLLALLTHAIVVKSDHDPSFCQLTTKKDKTGVVLDKQFYVAVSAQFSDKGKTHDLYEYADTINKRGSVYWTAQNMYKKIVFNYNTQQAFTIDRYKRPDADGACVVSALKDFKDATIGGGVRDQDGRILAPSAAGVFQLPTDGPIEFIGQTVARGINVNQWYRCIYRKNGDLSMKINYYFSNPSAWTISGQKATVAPVRVTVKGQYNGQKRIFDHTYDVTHYRTGIPPTEYPFQVPRGYYCEGLISKKNLPTAPSSFSYTAEVIDRYRATVTTLNERYNFLANLSRSSFMTVPGDPDRMNFGKGRLTKIYDFRRGIEYVKNHDIGNCSVKMLEKSDRDSTKNGRLVNPDQFFHLDNVKTLHYKGPQTARGQTVDVYVVRRPGFSFPSYANTTFEWGFATENSAIQNYVKPVWLNQIAYRTSLFDGAMFTYNFYDYNSAVPDFWDMDLTTCFKTHAQKHYTVHVTLSRQNTATILKYQVPNFKTEFAMILGKLIKVSLIRISDIDLTPDDKGFYVEFTLHERPPNAAGDKSGVELDLADALLVYNVKAGAVVLDFLSGSDKLEPVKVDADSLVELQQRPKYVTDLGYSSGEMAAVAFVLLLLALIGGALVGYLFWMRPATS